MRNPYVKPMIDESTLANLDAVASHTSSIWGTHIGNGELLIVKDKVENGVSYMSIDDCGAVFWQIVYDQYENKVTLLQGSMEKFINEFPSFFVNTTSC